MKRMKRNGNLSWTWLWFPTMVASTEFGYLPSQGLCSILCNLPLPQQSSPSVPSPALNVFRFCSLDIVSLCSPG